MKTILVVEDDESMRALVQLHLANAGYRVVVAEDAVDAGRLFLQDTPDLLLVDAELPYMSGFEFVSTMVADWTLPTIPILCMSAHERYQERFQKLGVEFVSKPFTVDVLLEKVRKLLGS